MPTSTGAIDPALIRKYDRPGPRYTSYPTALAFDPGVDRAALLADLEAGTGPLSLYFHVPFCETLCWFCGCTMVRETRHDRADVYLDYLAREIERTLPHLRPDRPVTQLHFGGGTPNFLTTAQIERHGQLIHDHFCLTPDAECSVELDPRRLTREQVLAFRAIGVTRASFGVQDVHPDVQAAIHRIQPEELNRQAVQWLREAGFTSLNLDLIYGLPRQTVESFAQTIDRVLAYEPDRFAVFSYAHVPWVRPAQRILEKHTLPSPEEKLAMLRMFHEKLTHAGYVFIGMDHFARPGDELVQALERDQLHRNFQGYSTRAGAEVLAFGMSAISQGAGAYRQNEKTLDDYYAALDEHRLPLARGYLLTDDDQLRRDVIMAVMCRARVDFPPIEDRHGIRFLDTFADAWEALTEFEADGLVVRHPDALEITPRGRFFVRNIAMCFDARLPALPQQRFSRTV